MLKQLMQRSFIQRGAGTLEEILASNIQQADTSAALQQMMTEIEVEKNDLEEARQALAQALEREKQRVPEKEEQVAYFPRDPVMSLVQSALQDYCEIRKPEYIVKPSAAARLAAEVEVAVTDEQIAETLSEFIAPTKEKAFDDFEKLDIGWANCMLAAAIRRWRGRYPFNPKPATPYKISKNARVILVSDWGSGLPRARKVGEAIRKELLDPKAANRDKHVIHLGDVYYSGWAKEYENNFLPYWPVREDEADKFSSWSLNANHDMYSGGSGYFNYLLTDPRFKAQEQSSFFTLENDKWLLVALDTGYHTKVIDPHDLYGDQNKWVSNLLANSKKTGILLSHHQPFSAFAKGGKKILARLEEPLTAGLVRGWFWGHEHRCTFYEERHNIRYPRCIGHGGIPFYVSEDPLPKKDGVIYEYRDGFDDLLETWNYFGFVVLDFEDDVINARYINERSKEHKTEELTRL